jgi:hypothetical protein
MGFVRRSRLCLHCFLSLAWGCPEISGSLLGGMLACSNPSIIYATDDEALGLLMVERARAEQLPGASSAYLGL